ncbi:hypothetical protein [Dactylosporangium salmoneum]|uniref:Carboxypeptidase regulatory-like domain-containing protein n=1 Tax=Dactylosporangium salmoneum TaxID=53361 RepID=A0ABP5TUW7_9ACTN
MPDLTDLLTAAAMRQHPARPPAFAEVLRVYRRRARRRHAGAAAAVALTLGAVGALTVLAGQPAGPPTTVTVTGTLMLTGGRLTMNATPVEHGVAGTVWFKAGNGSFTSTTAGRDGRFRIMLAPGRYRVTGRPAYLDASSAPGNPDTSASPAADAPAAQASRPGAASPTSPAPTVTSASSDTVVLAPNDLNHQPCWALDPIDVATGVTDDVRVLCQMR